MSYWFKGELPKLKEKYETFDLKRIGHLVHIEFCRPEEFNSTNLQSERLIQVLR